MRRKQVYDIVTERHKDVIFVSLLAPNTESPTQRKPKVETIAPRFLVEFLLLETSP